MCQSGYYNTANSSTNCYNSSTTPKGHYLDQTSTPYIYRACMTNCDVCTDATSCQTCSNGYFYDQTNKQCNQCYNLCATCSQTGTSSQNNCNTCKTNYHPDGSTAPFNCLPECYETCATCSKAGTGSNNNCDTCIANYFPLADAKSQCYKWAPLGYYKDEVNSQWSLCPGASSGSHMIISQLEIISLTPSKLYTYQENSSRNSFTIHLSGFLSNMDPLATIKSAYLLRGTDKIWLSIDSVKCKDIVVSFSAAEPSYNYLLFIVDGEGNVIESPVELEITGNSFWDQNESRQSYVSGLIQSGQTVQPTVYHSSTSSFQMYTSDSMSEVINQSVENNISYIDLGESEQVIRNYFNIQSPLIVTVVDTIYPGTFIRNSNYQLFNPFDGSMIDTSIVPSFTMSTYFPIRMGWYKLRQLQTNTSSAADVVLNHLDLARKMSNTTNVNIFNPDDPFFNDICYIYHTDNADVPLALRRSNYYFNVTMTCSAGCTSSGVQANIDYVSCECDSKTTNSSNVFEFKELPEINTNVLDVFRCSQNMFNNLSQNYGFIFFMSVFWFSIVGTLLIFFFWKPSKP